MDWPGIDWPGIVNRKLLKHIGEFLNRPFHEKIKKKSFTLKTGYNKGSKNIAFYFQSKVTVQRQWRLGERFAFSFKQNQWIQTYYPQDTINVHY